ncbi:hypothetical protein [Bacillus sp. V33-4]|uniref:hypothetical protein n=1 Tax=Bacillus sp. V33-4 TaxID=2054169 RepID=UPI001C60C4AC|nr:hypothetical protein [Bacillus sp. V33-4]
MSVRHYVLLATDGFIDLPVSKTICPSQETKQRIYAFGFVGGLFKVDEKIINPVLDWTTAKTGGNYLK